MKQSSDSDLWLTSEGYHRLIEQLALMVHESGWKFDRVLCLARGGMRPGDILSRIFDVPLAILSTSSYREEMGQKRGELDIAQYITTTRGPIAGRILLVDDLVDSGVTLKKVQEHMLQTFPDVTEVKTAVIWCKACSIIKPDFYVDYLEHNPWIHQPFEDYDGIRPHQLASWIKRGEAKT